MRESGLRERQFNTALSAELARLVAGLLAIAAVTGAGFQLGATLASVAFIFMAVIVLASLYCRLPSLFVLCAVADGCLNYFFTLPLFSLRVDYPQDVIALGSFFFTALVITTFVRRARVEHEERARALQRLDETRAQLARAGRLASLGELSASMGHELKQPLSATIANARAALRWLQRQPPDLAETRSALERILRDNQRAVEILERIRALSKSQATRRERVDIHSAIREVLELARGEIVSNGVAVRTEFAAGAPFVNGDRVELQQVALNLVANAIDAMAGEPTRNLLIATTESKERRILVKVQDSGCGLTPDRLANLFQPFYSTKPDGLGLGLSICRDIVERHGGRLWAEPAAPRGALFQFTLPEDSNGDGPTKGDAPAA